MSTDTKKTDKNSKLRKNAEIIILIILFTYSIVVEIFGYTFTDNNILFNNYNTLISRVLGGFFVLLVLLDYKFNIFKFKSFRNFLKSLLIILPSLLISINNLPIYALINQNAQVTQPLSYMLLFGASCLSIGFFEELLFRGLIFILILQRHPKTTKGIFWSVIISSAIFGLSHIFNLLAGAGFGVTILQVGYSFLMGCMWSVILLKTGNIWLCVILHSIYDFCGLLIPQMGQGVLWDIPTVIFTVILSIIVALYVLKLLLKLNPKKSVDNIS